MNESIVKKLIETIDRPEVREAIASELPQIALVLKPYQLRKLISEYLKYPEALEVIVNNFDMLLDSYDENVDQIAILALQTEEGRKKVKENFYKIKDKCFPIETGDDLNTEGFFRFIRSSENVEGFEEEYEEYGYWAQLYEQIKVPEYRLDNLKVNMWKLDSNARVKLFGDINAKHQKDLEFANMVYSKDREEKKLILQNIANGNNYEYVSNGTSSFVIRAGDQIVKLGAGRRNYRIPYHPRIMMPYFRKQYSDDSVLEIFNFGNCETPDITDEKLLEIFKELEAAGIEWTDARKSNLLVLVKDNNIPDFVVSEDFNLFGFLEDDKFPTKNHKALKKGDIVICDLDNLYAKGDPMAKKDKGLPDEVIVNYLRSKKNLESEEVSH